MRNLLAGAQPLFADGFLLQVPAPALAFDTLVLRMMAGGGAEEFLHNVDERIQLGQPLLISGYPPLSVSVRYNQDPWLSLADFNAFLQGVSDPELAQGYAFTIRLLAADTQALSVEIIATYL